MTFQPAVPTFRGMADSNVLSALKDKRARLARELVMTHLRAVALKADLAAVDRCLKAFDAKLDPDTIEPKATRSRDPAWLPKGAGTRRALEILRETGEAMTTHDLSACVLQRYGRGPLEE